MKPFEKFGKELKELRTKAGVKQMDVARKLKLNNGQLISNWERGLCMPPVKDTKTLAKLYKCPVETMVNLLVKAQKEKIEAAVYGKNRR